MKNKNEFNPAMVLMTFLLLFLFWLNYILRKKYTKDEIAKEYNISKPTLNKWISAFYQEQYSEWLKMRKVSYGTYLKLKERFGSNTRMVMNKEQMCDEFSTNNKYLRKIISERGYEIGIDEAIWNSYSVYPPNIVVKIGQMVDMK